MKSTFKAHFIFYAFLLSRWEGYSYGHSEQNKRRRTVYMTQFLIIFNLILSYWNVFFFNKILTKSITFSEENHCSFHILMLSAIPHIKWLCWRYIFYTISSVFNIRMVGQIILGSSTQNLSCICKYLNTLVYQAASSIQVINLVKNSEDTVMY